MCSFLYKHVIFDCYGCLVYIVTDEKQASVWQCLARHYQHSGADYDAESLEKAYQEIWVQEFANAKARTGLDYPELELAELFASLYDLKAPQHLQDRKEWGRQTARYFRELSLKELSLYPATQEVLKTLKAWGCHLYLLSNAQADFTREELDKLGITTYFDAIYLSSDYGMRKPQAEFLMKLLDDQALDEEETVMIGNDLATDMAIAERLGIDAILVNSFSYSQETLDREKNPKHPVITDLKELLRDDWTK